MLQSPNTFCVIYQQLIGEETTALSGSFEITDVPTWIVDPVDGTTNFVHRCVSKEVFDDGILLLFLNIKNLSALSLDIIF